MSIIPGEKVEEIIDGIYKEMLKKKDKHKCLPFNLYSIKIK